MYIQSHSMGWLVDKETAFQAWGLLLVMKVMSGNCLLVVVRLFGCIYACYVLSDVTLCGLFVASSSKCVFSVATY